jgi:hypothetical protein
MENALLISDTEVPCDRIDPADEESRVFASARRTS